MRGNHDPEKLFPERRLRQRAVSILYTSKLWLMNTCELQRKGPEIFIKKIGIRAAFPELRKHLRCFEEINITEIPSGL